MPSTDVATRNGDSTETFELPPGKHRLAGMALRNGVLVIGPTKWAAAVRDDKGRIHSVSKDRPTLGPAVDRFPALRGPIRLGEMLMILPALRTALPQARLAIESPSIIGTTAAGSLLQRGLRRRFGKSPISELASGAGSLALLLAALRGGELSQYHGAEHKVIGGYERDMPAVDVPKEHDRCGTQLAVPMLLTNAAALEGTRMLLPGNARLARVIGMGVGVAAATEFARATQRNQDHWSARAAARIGTGLQSVASTREPSADQLEVAQRALDTLLAAEDAA